MCGLAAFPEASKIRHSNGGSVWGLAGQAHQNNVSKDTLPGGQMLNVHVCKQCVNVKRKFHAKFAKKNPVCVSGANLTEM